LACESYNNGYVFHDHLDRSCTEADTLMEQAAAESDPEIRAQLYRQLEEMLFGPEGEYPIIPLFEYVIYGWHQPWISGPFDTDHLLTSAHYDWYTIDPAARP
jgi:ABC-type transport system substrate-binding protein